MDAVYRAPCADGQSEQQVAIKIVDMPQASDFFRERFRTERQMLAGLAGLAQIPAAAVDAKLQAVRSGTQKTPTSKRGCEDVSIERKEAERRNSGIQGIFDVEASHYGDEHHDG